MAAESHLEQGQRTIQSAIKWQLAGKDVDTASLEFVWDSRCQQNNRQRPVHLKVWLNNRYQETEFSGEQLDESQNGLTPQTAAIVRRIVSSFQCQ